MSRFSLLIGFLVQVKRPKFLIQSINRYLFTRVFKINEDEAEQPIQEYTSVLACFTRKLKSGVRPIEKAEGLVVSPADGLVNSFGEIKNGEIALIKKRTYKLSDFLVDHSAFENGYQITVYLSPRDYHRVHHPLDTELSRVVEIAGERLPVNDFSIHHFDQVFPRNKRTVFHYTKELAMVMVGALNVGKIVTAYQERHEKKSEPFKHKLFNVDEEVKAGEEAGVFCLGSTVVLLFPSHRKVKMNVSLGAHVLMGQGLAYLSGQ